MGIMFFNHVSVYIMANKTYVHLLATAGLPPMILDIIRCTGQFTFVRIGQQVYLIIIIIIIL